MNKEQPPVEAVDTKAGKDKPKPVVAAKPVAAASNEPVFTVAQLRPSARKLFGISQSTYDGATCDIDPEQTFTVEAMREQIDKWLKEEY